MIERPLKYGPSMGSPHHCTRKELARALLNTCGITTIPKDVNLRAFALGKIRKVREVEAKWQAERFSKP